MIMHAMPGIDLKDIEGMEWAEVIAWWNVARGILEGPADQPRRR